MIKKKNLAYFCKKNEKMKIYIYIYNYYKNFFKLDFYLKEKKIEKKNFILIKSKYYIYKYYK